MTEEGAQRIEWDEITLEAAVTMLEQGPGIDPDTSKAEPATAIERGLKWLPAGRISGRKREAVVRGLQRIWEELPTDHPKRQNLATDIEDATDRTDWNDD